MAKIAFVELTKLTFEYHFKHLASLLVDSGHDVMAVYSGGEPPEDKRVKHGDCYWLGISLGPLVNFSPDYIVVFNGSHPQRYAATRYMEKRWRVFYVENGWLPQSGNLYLDTKGIGAKGAIGEACYLPLLSKEHREKREAELTRLRIAYTPKNYKTSLPKDYVLVPLQVENDTSIVIDSPYFKSMATFVSYVHRHFCDRPIVVKAHPKDDGDRTFPGVIMVRGDTPMNDLVPGASMVIGINSTSLIEALVHYKPVAALGYNVASRRGAYVGEPEELMSDNPRAVIGREVNKEAIDNALYWLLQNQFPRTSPPKTLLKYFED